MSKPQRRAAVLWPLFSMRTASGWGVGEIPDLPHAAAWAAEAGFRVLQLLPVGEVCGGETSPYAGASAFALDPVYLGLDECEDFELAGGRAALADADHALLDEVTAAATVNWAAVRALKARAAARAFARFQRDEWARSSARARALRRFAEENAAWIDDYALFAVLHDRFRTSWLDWPEPLRDRRPDALAAARAEHGPEILQKIWLQWLLDDQWHAARAEAHALGVELKGDLPFVVSADSADVWSRRDDFRPACRVGTPPDAFSEEGQDWGLPLYDWPQMQRSGFAWMRARAERLGQLYALYRVDHVIGMYRTYFRCADGTSGFSPATETEQLRLGETLLGILAGTGEVVAEDLGMVPDFLRPSLTKLGIPGYKVLRWEKTEVRDAHAAREVYVDPATWPVLSVACSSTHDITSNAEWWDSLTPAEREPLLKLPPLRHLRVDQRFDDEVRDALLRVLYLAPSELVAVSLQDALGTRERINVPGTVNDRNWTFRMPMELGDLRADRATSERLARLAVESERR